MSNVLIAVGSTYGNANQSAIACQEILIASGFDCRITDFASLADVVTDLSQKMIICTSTTGMGDVPDNLMPLLCQLKDETPNLSCLHYGILGLGDSSYDCFNGGAKQMDSLLSSLGAERIGEPCLVDACTDPVPENVAGEWIQTWIAQLKQAEVLA